ncbi:MAG: phosphotransferase family protein [Porticoccaceae bacterium]|nr:phosphotransferase family protein [Porticoccaceae bacterium]
MTIQQNSQHQFLLEPRFDYIYKRKLKARATGPYTPKTDQEVTEGLHKLFANMGLKDVVTKNVKRMAGGASKEQFAFELSHADMTTPQRYVLRMDPLEGIVETCRLREAQLLTALRGILPVPAVLAVDADGEFLGRPGVITEFVQGVTAPPAESGKGVSGIGITYGSYAAKLAPQFVRYMAALHSWSDWQPEQLSTYFFPAKGTKEAPLYQIDYWAKAWDIDFVEPVPMITFATNWLRDNAPVCDDPCMLHCDYRIGNFLFDADSGKITSILDWELSHVGDFHEDLAWSMHSFFGSKNEQGEFLVCCLLPRQEFISEYEKLSGRKVDLKTLNYYQVMNSWKCALMGWSSAIIAAQNGNNHQDLLITWLGSAGGVHISQTIELIREYEKNFS